MCERVKLKIQDIVGSSIWADTRKGKLVYDEICKAFSVCQIVDLSFEGREVLITAFLNTAIGQLYNGTFTEEFIQKHLQCVDISEADQEKVTRSIVNAKAYFKNPEGYDTAWKQETGHGAK